MNKKTLYIDGTSSQMTTIKQITQAHKEFAGFLVIDLSEVNFPLTRDFFLVLSRRIPRDLYSLVLPDSGTLAIAKALGIQSEVSGMQHEFNKKYSEKNLATHNMTMLEYLIYEIRRGFAYVAFFLSNRTQNHKKIIHLQKNSSQFFRKSSLFLYIRKLCRPCSIPFFWCTASYTVSISSSEQSKK